MFNNFKVKHNINSRRSFQEAYKEALRVRKTFIENKRDM